MRNSIQVLDNYFPIKIVNPETITQNIVQSNQENKVITIVPESGALNNDFLNQCSVCSMTETGERLPVFAALLNTDNDTIAKFNTDQTGWGIVSFIHQAGEEYRVIDLSTKTELSLIIKETLPEGMEFSFTNTDDYIRISASGLIEDRVKVLVHRNYSWYAQQSISVQGGEILMAIPLDTLPNGILQVSILNMNNEVLFKRLLINGTVIGNDPDILFEEIPGDKPSYTSILTISDRFGEGERLVSNILTRECPLNLFENYIPGLPGWPVSYDIPAGDNARKGWLIANSYPDDVPISFYPGKSTYPQQVQYNNLTIIEQREAMFSFMPETRGPAISGLLSDSEGEPLRNQLVAATMLSDNSMFAGFTFGSGRFHLSIPGIKDLHDFVIVPTSSALADWKLDIEQRFDMREVSLPETSFSLSLEEIMFVRELDINRQLETIFVDTRSVASDTNRVSDKKYRSMEILALKLLLINMLSLQTLER